VRGFLNLAVLVVMGVMLADLVLPSHVSGTNALFNGVGGLWKTSINGLLGQTS
jgi:hypothetical protein